MLSNKELEDKLELLRKEYKSATISEKEIIKRQARCLQIIQEKRKLGGLHSKR
jgi:hypothetical protein